MHNNEVQKTIGKNVKTSLPKVSVIIPAYDVAVFIAETLDSVLAQTFEDLETIVINDGSPDSKELEKVLTPYFDSIIYLKQSNKGAAAARNAGIEAARGEILAFLDGDDIWLPDYLEEQVKFLQASGNDMVYCDAYFFGNEKRYARYMERSPSTGEVTTENLLSGNSNVITSGTIVSREKIIAAGGFDENAPARIEDFDLWFRLLKNGAKAGYQKKVLLKYRVRAEGLSGGSVKIAERTVTAFSEVKKKYDLTENEQRAWAKKFDEAEKLVQVEKGKACLINDEFEQARAHFAEANKKQKKLKLSLLTFLLKVSPRTAQKIFSNFRADEAASFVKK